MRTRLAALALAAGLFSAATASAGIVPNPGNWLVPTHVNLVGSSGGVPDPAGEFFVVVRDLANNPVPGVFVVLDLSGAPDLRMCASQHDPALEVHCAAAYAGKYTDANGRVAITLAGGGHGPASSRMGSGKIFGDGILATVTLIVGAFDLDGVGGVSGNDLSQWLGSFLGDPTMQRNDFDGSGSIGGNDLSLLLGAYGSGLQTESCTSVCP